MNALNWYLHSTPLSSNSASPPLSPSSFVFPPIFLFFLKKQSFFCFLVPTKTVATREICAFANPTARRALVVAKLCFVEMPRKLHNTKRVILHARASERERERAQPRARVFVTRSRAQIVHCGAIVILCACQSGSSCREDHLSVMSC